VLARVVVVEGEVEGRLEATEALHLKKTARVRGELVAPRVVLEDGCRFQGSIDMESKRAASSLRERAAAATPNAVPSASSEKR
jgi:cytoskeletal protein CcmA (bactofilin family)